MSKGPIIRLELRYGLVAIQALFVLALAAISSRSIPFELTRPMAAALILWSFGFMFLLVRVLVSTLRSDDPLHGFFRNFRGEAGILVRAFFYALLLGLAMALHGWAKTMIPYAGGYWADPALADLDHFLFGQDPWPLFRSDWLVPLYAKLYVGWFLFTFGTMGMLAFSKRDHSVLLTAALAMLVIGGTVGQYLLPSVGPIYYERFGYGPRFAELVATNHPNFTHVADYLWKNYQLGSANIGTGISAMPSMHVTWAVWTVFAAHALWRPLAIPAAAYALLVWMASIASGWHYATDGATGAALAIGIVIWLSRRKSRSASVQPKSGAPRPALAG